MLANLKSEFSTNLKLASPVMVGMLGHTLVSFVDNIMVGQLGTAQLAAVSLGNSFIFIAMAIGMGFSMALTPLVAEADGAGDKNLGKSWFKHGLILCSVLGILLFALLVFAKPLMYLMKQPEEVVVLAIPYLDLVALSLIPLIMFQAFKQFSDGLSMTRLPMYATLSSNILNVFLNYVLIFGKWGFPEMGIIGAAYGTLISRGVMLLHVWWMLRNNQKSRYYVTDISVTKISRRAIKKVIDIGMPSALQMFFEVGIFTAAIWLSGLLGKNPQAANQIALNLSSMTFMVATGLGVAAMIRVGNQKGLKDYKELRRLAFSIFSLSLVLAIGFAMVFAIFHNQLPKLYVDYDDALNATDNLEVVKIASTLLIAAAIFQISDAIQVVVLGALRGLQDVRIPTLITFLSYWLIGFPVSYYFGKEEILGSFGIWMGLLAGLSSAALLLFIRFHKLSQKLIHSSSIPSLKPDRN